MIPINPLQHAEELYKIHLTYFTQLCKLCTTEPTPPAYATQALSSMTAKELYELKYSMNNFERLIEEQLAAKHENSNTQ